MTIREYTAKPHRFVVYDGDDVIGSIYPKIVGFEVIVMGNGRPVSHKAKTFQEGVEFIEEWNSQ